MSAADRPTRRGGRGRRAGVAGLAVVAVLLGLVVAMGSGAASAAPDVVDPTPVSAPGPCASAADAAAGAAARHASAEHRVARLEGSVRRAVRATQAARTAVRSGRSRTVLERARTRTRAMRAALREARSVVPARGRDVEAALAVHRLCAALAAGGPGEVAEPLVDDLLLAVELSDLLRALPPTDLVRAVGPQAYLDVLGPDALARFVNAVLALGPRAGVPGPRPPLDVDAVLDLLGLDDLLSHDGLVGVLPQAVDLLLDALDRLGLLEPRG